MQKRITRRNFLTQAVAGSAGLVAASAGIAMSEQPTQKGENLNPFRPNESEYAAMLLRQKPYEDIVRLPVLKDRLIPHWFSGNSRFWYRNQLRGAAQEFILVDAEKGTRQLAFDHARLAAGLSKASGNAFAPDRLPFINIQFNDDDSSVLFDAGGTVWQCDLKSYSVTRSTETKLAGDDTKGKPSEDNSDTPEPSETPSPDGSLIAFIKNHNVALRDAKSGGESTLSTQGTADRPFGRITWSPDSKTVVAFKIDSVPVKPVYMIESSPKQAGTRGILHQHEYEQPGDDLSKFEMWSFPVGSGLSVQSKIDTIDFWDGTNVMWRNTGDKLYFERTDRGHQRFRIFEIDTRTGNAKAVLDERAATFINTSNQYTYYPASTPEILYASEQDGWRHLYLRNTDTGLLKNQITRGNWVVRSVDFVDEDKRQIWFQASGKNDGEDPYFLHSYRVNFDGSGLVALTEGDGTHTAQYSPDRKYIVDSYSRTDLPPIHTLRRTTDGSLILPLEQADASQLTAMGWCMPEPFAAKGRDGQTDIWGVVFRPFKFDPRKKYPVIESIYAGPQDSFVWKSFSVRYGMQSLANLGFIVVQCDGMGTRNRSKAFHDVCWRNIKDAGFPDRIAWIRALAAKYPYCDTSRVGIYGTSAGGQNSTGALLFHPEFYKVGVSSCGCHDNRIDKRWWNEQWMGYPVGDWYAESSNIDNAGKLRGKLLLFVGELDSNVPPESTIRLTDALMKAGKDFDFLVITGSDHTSGGDYGERRRRDYFTRHLLGVEPPDRNAPPPVLTPVHLPEHSIGEEMSAQSEEGVETSIEFRNKTGKTVELYWLPGNGVRTSYGEIAPGENKVLHTYAGHWWLAKIKDGHPLAIFIGEDHPGIADINN